MAEHPVETTLRAALWQQFGAAIAMLENALLAYLKHLRKKCQSTLNALSDEQAHQPFHFPWPGDEPMSYVELQLYNMRHAQEHAAQLSLFLGQHGVPDEALDWVSRARDEAGKPEANTSLTE